MKLTNAQIFDLAQVLETLMGKQLPVRLAFQISQIFLKLEEQRKAVAMVIESLPKNEEGMPEEAGFSELLNIENELDVSYINTQEVIRALDSISPRQVLSLMPVLKEGEE